MRKPSENLPQPRWINIEDFEFICFNLAKELMEFNEPIPDYSTRDTSLLESSLMAPKNAFNIANATIIDRHQYCFTHLLKITHLEMAIKE